MDEQRDKTRRKRGGSKADMKVGEIKKQHHAIKSKEDRYVKEHHQGSHKITKKEFMTVLTKAAQPVSEWQHDQEGTETSGSRPSDGCNETHKNQGKTGDKEG